MSSPTVGVDAAHSEADTDYASSIDRLIDLYSDVDKASLSLPAFSVRPILIYFWSCIKFEFALTGDLFLLIPINAVVFFRNLFPGRWRYKSFAWPYLRYGFMWIWRGECYVGLLFARPITAFLLSSHFRRRLLAVRRRLLVDRNIREQSRRALLSKIDDALNIWQVPSATTAFFSYLLPAVGPAIELARPFIPADLPPWTSYVVLTSISYALAIFGTAFLVKRGLMLGGTGRSVFFPATVEKPGAYAEEKKLLSVFGIDVVEFPLDAGVMIVAAIIMGLQFVQMQSGSYAAIGLPVQDPEVIAWAFGILIGVTLVLIAFAWQRRKKLQRA